MVKTKTEQKIIDALEEHAVEHGADIVDVEMAGASKAPTVRVRIEGADGSNMDLDAVTAQTKWVGDVIEALDPVAGSYTLEVSSPGMARPLRRPCDFIRFVGEDIEFTSEPIDGRHKWTGKLSRATDESFTLVLEDETAHDFVYDQIRSCKIKPVYDFSSAKEGN